MLQRIGISLLKTILISALFAGAGLLFNFPFIQVFAASMCVQFILFFIWNSVMEYSFRSKLERIETERLELYAQQGVDVTCAYCGRGNFVPVRFDEDNEFECEHCEETNAIYVRVTTTQITDILETDRLSASAYIKDKIDASEKPDEEDENE